MSTKQARGVRDKAAWLSVNFFEAYVVPKTGSYCITAADMLRHLGITEIEDTCPGYGQVFMFADSIGQIVSRSHNDFDLLPAIKQLLYEQSPGYPVCSSNKNSRVLFQQQ